MRATATPTIRFATSGIARATVTTRTSTARVSSTRTSIGEGFKEGYDRGYREVGVSPVASDCRYD